ncbi:four helix bundle suffix domain-containing protein [Desulfoplanes sp.]
MTQAARSGRQNIIEGSERAATSKDTEMKLTDVARASLGELRGDFGIMILERNQLPWSVRSPEAKAVSSVSLDQPCFKDDMVRESARHALKQRCKYARWLDADDLVIPANAMLIIIGRAMKMLKRQIETQGKTFEQTGGFQERLTANRLEARDKDMPPSPACPLCGNPMRRRTSARGPFWGCSAHPDCKGIRPIEEK